jgi:hypothetical protein
LQPNQAMELVAYLKAAYEREQVSTKRLQLTSNMLADLSYDEVHEAVQHIISTEQYFPTVAQLRRYVAERRLGLPDTAAAWELAAAWAAWRPQGVQPCTGCGGTALDEQRDGPCTRCKGTGEEQQVCPVVLPEPVLRAAQLVGGRAGIRAADPVPVVRSQFTKAYLQFREEEIMRVQVPEQLQLAAQARRAALVNSEEVPALELRNL